MTPTVERRPAAKELTVATALTRTRLAIRELCAAVDGAAWWISGVEAGSRIFHVLDREIRRDRRGADDDIYPIGDACELDHLPWTDRALRGHHFWVGINDADVDPREQARLAERGYTGNLAAGWSDASGEGWLVEVFADPLTAPLTHLGPELNAVLRNHLDRDHVHTGPSSTEDSTSAPFPPPPPSNEHNR